jgi:peptide/nickel transport system permease protein
MAYERLFQRPIAVITFVIIALYTTIAILDSIHFQYALPKANQSHTIQYESKVRSLFDLLMGERASRFEKSYSAPFSLHQYVKESKPDGGQYYPRLKYIPKTLQTLSDRNNELLLLTSHALILSFCLVSLPLLFFYVFRRKYGEKTKTHSTQHLLFYVVASLILLFIVLELYFLSTSFHVLGTGKVGQDIFYFTLKSIRTGLFIGLLTTLVMLPFALILGISAGFFGRRIDDAIQYIYITVSSVPGVLLIAASVLSMQVFIVNHPSFFPTLSERADARLIALCVILGLTSWTGLCRMLRAESLKIREIDYIQAAKALGSSSRFIIFKHIMPNVMHLILIAVVLDFSFLVLAEAVLSYIGVGVSPLTISWGNMINGARLELAREPLVWWPMAAAFIFMFILVLVVNLFADALRDVFDPRTH